MPKFVYTLFLLFFGNVLFFLYILLFVPPQKPLAILLFFGSLHLLLSLFASLALFLANYKKYKKFNMPNIIFRRMFRRIFIFIALFIGIKVMKTFSVHSLLNTSVFCLFIVVVYLLTELRNRLPSHSAI